ncbi:MAG: hypothetical protein NTY53_23950 [Kiritimatiellaeota bacterium]|nr:hypothetical protein [Kiritimatiellota bacterium]
MGIREGNASVSVWQVVKRATSLDVARDGATPDLVVACAKENAPLGLVGWRHWQDWVTTPEQLNPAAGLTMLQWMECRPSAPASLVKTEVAKAVLRWQAEHPGEKLARKKRTELTADVKHALIERAQPSYRGFEIAWLEAAAAPGALILSTAVSAAACATLSHEAQVQLGLQLKHESCEQAVRAAGLDDRNWRPASFGTTPGLAADGQGELFADDCWHDFLTLLFFQALKSEKFPVRMDGDAPLVFRAGSSGRKLTLKKWFDQEAAVFGALGRGAKLEKMRIKIEVAGENNLPMVVSADVQAGELDLRGCKVHGVPKDELDLGRQVRIRVQALQEAWRVVGKALVTYADIRSHAQRWEHEVESLKRWIAAGELGEAAEKSSTQRRKGQTEGAETNGQDGQDGPAPTTVNITAATAAAVDETLVQQAMEIIQATGRASVSTVQRRLKLGYTAAANIMDVLEERGILGKAKGVEPREIHADKLAKALKKKPEKKKGGRT